MTTPYAPEIPTGGEGVFSKGGTEFAIIGWSGGEEGSRVDITTTKDRNKVRKKTYTRQLGAKLVYRAEIEAFADNADGLIAALRVNDVIDTIVLKNSDTGYEASMAHAIIESMPIKTGGVEGASSYTFTIASQGDYDVSVNGVSIDLVAGP